MRAAIMACYKYPLQVLLQLMLQGTMKEKPIEDYLREQWTYRTRGEAVKLPPLFYKGLPDQMCMATFNIICFVETKRPEGGVVSKAQQLVHDRWRKRGHWVEVAYTYEMIDTLIDRVCEYITNLTRTKTKD